MKKDVVVFFLMHSNGGMQTEESSRMAKKSNLTLEKAIALQLKTGPAVGVGQCITQLARDVRHAMGDLLITTAQVMAVLRKWAADLFVELTKSGYVKIVGRGALHIHNLARSAAA